MDSGHLTGRIVDVSIIIVSYNTKTLTLSAIRAAIAETHVTYELIVVDNASTDGSAEAIRREYPEVRLIEPDENLGFAAANNHAAREASGRYLLLLNPDTVVLDEGVDKLVYFADANPSNGVYGGGTRFADMSRNPTSAWNRPSPWSLVCGATGLTAAFRGSRLFDPESLASWDWSGPREVEVVTGCFLLITRELWQLLDGFDLRFKMYGEDADLSFRAKQLGYQPVVFPEAQIIHYGGASERMRAEKMIRLYRAKSQLFRKHWSRATGSIMVALLVVDSFAKTLAHWAITLIRPGHRDSFVEWRSIFKRRNEWTVKPL